MSSIISYLKHNKLVVLLSLIIVFFLINSLPKNQYSSRPIAIANKSMIGQGNLDSAMTLPSYEAAPAPEVKDRLVIKESNLSLLVNKVGEAQKEVLRRVEEMGGYMVSTSLSNPQDQATATVVVRIPAEKLEQTLDSFRKIAVKVISENLQGQDVTDQYVDLQARLDTLQKTKDKFEQIMDRATLVSEILEVQRELINLQAQIDSIKGQQQYLEKNAQMAKITIYLSTDELSLPYSPSKAWRPSVIFKQAVRSLMGAFIVIGTLAIWIAVFSVIWLPILLIVRYLRKRKK